MSNIYAIDQITETIMLYIIANANKNHQLVFLGINGNLSILLYHTGKPTTTINMLNPGYIAISQLIEECDILKKEKVKWILKGVLVKK